jgi:hypothetical protein
MLSASLVEPRTSAKRTVVSTSAPPSFSWANSSQKLQMVGFSFEGWMPKKVRAAAPPTPPKG